MATSAHSARQKTIFSIPSPTTDFTAEMDVLDERFKNNEITRDEYLQEVDRLYKESGKDYGTIKQGEGDVTVKEGNHFDLCTELLFPDDTILREVLCNGRNIIKVKPIG